MLTYITCSSEDYAYAECAIPSVSVISSAAVSDQLSSASCNYYSGLVEDYTGTDGVYGYTSDGIWVYEGCRAEFVVCGGTVYRTVERKSDNVVFDEYLDNNLGHVMTKPDFAICEQQRRRSACASTQSDQRLCCSLPGSYNTYTC